MEREIRQIVFETKEKKTLRTAAYCRVSCGKDAMLHSLKAQADYYEKLIRNNPEWTFCGVYADEAFTGTKAERPAFQKMLADCRAGKIDQILVKSISRFARNTVALLTTVRELKTLGVDVCFEEQGIRTMSAAGELMLTILASFAQEESRSVSENMKWRISKNFEAGIPWNGTVFGYRLQDGKYVVKPDEAKVVKKIFAWYLSGMGYMAIAKKLNEAGVKTRNGNDWNHTSVLWILHNYSYTGNLLLQTTFTESYITKKYRKNTGEKPMFHAQQTHEPIVSEETFNAAQREMQKRSEKYMKPERQNASDFSGKVFCGICGKRCRRKQRHGKPVWICNTYSMQGKAVCPAKAVPEEILSKYASEISGEAIKKIHICNENELCFELRNGDTITKQWQGRSRRDSWTDEMKQKARSRYYADRNANSGDQG